MYNLFQVFIFVFEFSHFFRLRAIQSLLIVSLGENLNIWANIWKFQMLAQMFNLKQIFWSIKQISPSEAIFLKFFTLKIPLKLSVGLSKFYNGCFLLLICPFKGIQLNFSVAYSIKQFWELVFICIKIDSMTTRSTTKWILLRIHWWYHFIFRIKRPSVFNKLIEAYYITSIKNCSDMIRYTKTRR